MPLSLEIEESLFALSAEERYALGNRLLDSIDDEIPDSMTPEEILAEAERRDQELESGLVEPISMEELQRRLRQEFPFLSENRTPSKSS
jgi:putative addiction module component (TIGR02574 family)